MRESICPKCRDTREFVTKTRLSGGYQYQWEECTRCGVQKSANRVEITRDEQDILDHKYFREERITKQVRRDLGR